MAGKQKLACPICGKRVADADVLARHIARPAGANYTHCGKKRGKRG